MKRQGTIFSRTAARLASVFHSKEQMRARSREQLAERSKTPGESEGSDRHHVTDGHAGVYVVPDEQGIENARTATWKEFTAKRFVQGYRFTRVHSEHVRTVKHTLAVVCTSEDVKRLGGPEGLLVLLDLQACCARIIEVHLTFPWDAGSRRYPQSYKARAEETAIVECLSHRFPAKRSRFHATPNEMGY